MERDVCRGPETSRRKVSLRPTDDGNDGDGRQRHVQPASQVSCRRSVKSSAIADIFLNLFRLFVP